jgi:hypothetical protein
MTTACPRQERGFVELFFYDELDAAAQSDMIAHLRVCEDCARALDDLKVIRDALASRPIVSAPPTGDWSGFMRRLDGAVSAEAGFSRPMWKRLTATGIFAAAALLAIVTMSVYFVARAPSTVADRPAVVAGDTPRTPVAVATTGIKAAGEDHFKRSKLVVLGLAAKEPSQTSVEDWAYERELASSLLDDTRLYRLAAEQHGLKSLARVMRDLELVLLETSMAGQDDKNALGQIQRLIEKRGLIEKMDTVSTVGM